MQLLGIPIQVLQQGLTHRKIEAKTEEVTWLTLFDFKDHVFGMTLFNYQHDSDVKGV